MKSKELEALVSLLGDEDEEIFTHVHSKLVELGGTIIPYLEQHWEQSMEPLAQRRIEEIIHELQFSELKIHLLDWKEGNQENLTEGMWLIATYQYPDLEINDIIRQIDKIYYEGYLALGNQTHHPLGKVRILNHVIFDRMGFSANTKNFHSPANSMINQVLETKKGNPISLSIIYLLVAQRLKIPVYGVNLPNLFVLTYKDFSDQFYINPFNKGIIFMRKDIDSYIDKLNLDREEQFFEPCDNLTIIKRVLRNLIFSFKKLGENQKQDELYQLLAVLEE